MWEGLLQLLAKLQFLGPAIAVAIGLLLWRFHIRMEQEKVDTRLRAERREAHFIRTLRVEDLLRAIHADIRVDRERLALQFEEPHASILCAKMVERLRDNRDAETGKDMPKGASAPTSFVFDLVRAELATLPSSTIEDVVRYYRYNGMLDKLVDAIVGGAYDRLSDQRQTEAINAYFGLGAQTLGAADAAIAAVSHALGAASETWPQTPANPQPGSARPAE